MSAALRSTPARWALAALTAAVAWALAAVLLPNGAPVGLVAIGAVLGSATGLAAVGIVLVWRANRVVNFAAGAIGGAAALGSLNLYLTWGWSDGVAVAVVRTDVPKFAGFVGLVGFVGGRRQITAAPSTSELPKPTSQGLLAR